MTPCERDGLSPDVIIIGCGNMGGALAAGYHARVPVIQPCTATATNPGPLSA